jgi:hypothetical protein
LFQLLNLQNEIVAGIKERTHPLTGMGGTVREYSGRDCFMRFYGEFRTLTFSQDVWKQSEKHGFQIKNNTDAEAVESTD